MKWFFRQTATSALSAFSADVDTTFYASVRESIESAKFPNKGAVWIVNNFLNIIIIY